MMRVRVLRGGLAECAQRREAARQCGRQALTHPPRRACRLVPLFAAQAQGAGEAKGRADPAPAIVAIRGQPPGGSDIASGRKSRAMSRPWGRRPARSGFKCYQREWGGYRLGSFARAISRPPISRPCGETSRAIIRLWAQLPVRPAIHADCHTRADCHTSADCHTRADCHTHADCHTRAARHARAVSHPCGQNPSRSIRLRSNLRARRTASAASRARRSDGFS